MCHKQFIVAIEQWKMEHGKTSLFPNMAGKADDSIAAFAAYCSTNWQIHKFYGYVPGLMEEDPKDLVLMYFKQKTRYRWHGDRTPLPQAQWLVFGPSWDDTETYDGREELPEGGVLEDTPTFKRRLQKTLDFLKDHNRPFCTNAVAEQSAFLNSIKE